MSIYDDLRNKSREDFEVLNKMFKPGDRFYYCGILMRVVGVINHHIDMGMYDVYVKTHYDNKNGEILSMNFDASYVESIKAQNEGL